MGNYRTQLAQFEGKVVIMVGTPTSKTINKPEGTFQLYTDCTVADIQFRDKLKGTNKITVNVHHMFVPCVQKITLKRGYFVGVIKSYTRSDGTSSYKITEMDNEMDRTIADIKILGLKIHSQFYLSHTRQIKRKDYHQNIKNIAVQINDLMAQLDRAEKLLCFSAIDKDWLNCALKVFYCVLKKANEDYTQTNPKKAKKTKGFALAS